MNNGLTLIADERMRQIRDEGYLSDHDDKHVDGEMAEAAACYALVGTMQSGAVLWPWETHYDKRDKHDRIRQLAIAGALLAAEIDRLQRIVVRSES